MTYNEIGSLLKIPNIESIQKIINSQLPSHIQTMLITDILEMSITPLRREVDFLTILEFYLNKEKPPVSFYNALRKIFYVNRFVKEEIKDSYEKDSYQYPYIPYDVKSFIYTIKKIISMCSNEIHFNFLDIGSGTGDKVFIAKILKTAGG